MAEAKGVLVVGEVADGDLTLVSQEMLAASRKIADEHETVCDRR